MLACSVAVTPPVVPVTTSAVGVAGATAMVAEVDLMDGVVVWLLVENPVEVVLEVCWE